MSSDEELNQEQIHQLFDAVEDEEPSLLTEEEIEELLHGADIDYDDDFIRRCEFFDKNELVEDLHKILFLYRDGHHIAEGFSREGIEIINRLEKDISNLKTTWKELINYMEKDNEL
jgi:hypothetical protein